MATKPAIITAIDQVKNAQALLTQELLLKRGRIAEINAAVSTAKVQIETLRKMPISLVDFGVYLQAHIQALGDAWIGSAKDVTRVRWDTDIAANVKAWQDFEPDMGTIRANSVFNEFTEPGGFNASTKNSNFNMLCFFFPEVVHARLMATYAEHSASKFAGSDVPTVVARRANIASTTEEIVQLEAEKATIVADIALMTEGIFPAEAGSAEP